MPLKRTPPTTPNMSKSDTDLFQLSSASPEVVENITTRYKRPRNSSPPEEMSCHNGEMRAIMESLQTSSLTQQAMMTKLIEEVGEIKKQNLQIQKTNTQIEICLESLKQSNEDMRKRIQTLEEERKDQHNYILNLENKITNLQQSSRSSCIEIRNIPAEQDESPSHLTSHVVNTGKVLAVNIQSSEVRDIYRTGKNKIIVAELKSVQMKNEILAAARKYNASRDGDQKLNTTQIGIKGRPTPIFVSEYLAGSDRKLFYMAREFAKNNNYQFCWVRNGNIFIKKDSTSKPLRVDSEAALNSLQAKK